MPVIMVICLCLFEQSRYHVTCRLASPSVHPSAAVSRSVSPSVRLFDLFQFKLFRVIMTIPDPGKAGMKGKDKDRMGERGR